MSGFPESIVHTLEEAQRQVLESKDLLAKIVVELNKSHKELADSINSNIALQSLLMRTKNILEQLYDDDPCSYDHDNYCQTHGLHEYPCPHGQVGELLEQLNQV